MDKFIFDLQRFDEVSIAAGDTYALDGVTYTALEDSRLTLDDDGKVSGIASGKVTATVTNKKNSPTVTFDASDGAIDFTATGDGSILTVTRTVGANYTFPIEFVSGEFTYSVNKITTSAGAVLASVNTLGSYSLRSEDHSEYGSTYTFSDTALTAVSEHATTIYTFNDGTGTNRFLVEQFGTVIIDYYSRQDTLTKGSRVAISINGHTLTATAVDDAALNLAFGADGLTFVPNTGDGTLNLLLTRGDTPLLAGELECTSGAITFGFDNSISFAKDTSFKLTQDDYTLTVTTTDEATIGISLQGNNLVFTPGQNDGGLNVLLTRGGTPVFGGVLNVTDGTITFDATTQKFSFTEGTNISLTLPSSTPRQVDFKVVGGDANVKIEADSSGKFILTPDNNDGALQISVSREGQTVFQNTFSVSGGSIVFDPATQSVGLTKGTTANVTLGNYTLAVKTTDDASFGLGVLGDGSIAVTPNEGDGALDIAIKRGNTTIFSNTVSVDGTIIFNPTTQAVTLTDGTTVSLSFGDYELIATANGNATTALSIAGNGVVITPNTGDGSLDLTLKSAGGSINANLEVLSGSFILGEGGALTVTKGTELRIDFGGGYIVNFKATDDAGGSLALGADGITFAPGSNDGGLELSVTQNGDTRTTNLNVTGAVTYKLDGTLSLAKGTVISNTWEDGAALTITATGDGVSNVRFDPDTGLTVTAEDTNLQLELNLPNGGVVGVDSIVGTLTYKSAAVTLAEGSSAHIMNYTIEQNLSIESGTTVIDFSEMADDPETSMFVYTVSDNGRSIIKTLNVDKALISTGGIFKTGANIQLLTPGSSIYGAAGDSGTGSTTFSLDGNGEYTVNGINVTVSNIDLHDKEHYGTAITLIDNKAIAFNPGTATISYAGTDFTGDTLIGIDNTGATAIVNAQDNASVNGTSFNDSITNSGDNVTINALGGNDTINSSGNDAMIDGGDGNNFISIMGGDEGSNIVMDGNTTVEGFKTGWGDGTDTVYVKAGGDPGVDFKSIGLSFYDSNDSLTLADVDDTAKVNLYYEASNTIARNVYIAQNDWYEVSNSDLNSGEGIYFVGTSATHNHGVDFSGVSQALNVSMNTDYSATNNSIWVNNIYSIRGGAGLTTITGTDDSDTVIAGTGSTTIDGAGGNDRISLGSAAALVKYSSGDGSDSIYGFNANSTISIGGAAYSSATSGNNLVLTVGSDNVTLFGAGRLDNPNIIGTTSGGGSGSTTSGGGSGSTTSGGGSSSTDDDKKALFGADDMYSIGKGGKLVTTPPNPGSGTPYTGSKDRGITVSAPTATVTPYVSGSSMNAMWRALAGIGNVTSSADAASSDVIYAGDGGSQLWGDSYGDEYGGSSSNDTINLAAATLDQISGAATSANATALNFTDGSSSNVWSDPAQVANFKPTDGSAYPNDNATDTWTKTN